MKYINKIGSKTILLILLFVGLLTACPLSADTTKLYKLTLKSNPSGAGSVSGGGNFVVGKSVNVSTYANSGYVFKGWFKDGENISKNKNFNYTMPSMDVMLTAEYVFDPSSPSDPQPADTTKLYKLTLKSNPSGAGSVSGGGNFAVGKSVNVSTYANSGYVFKGWFKDGENISKNKSINYTMPSMDVMLTAEYVFDPSSPSEPQQPTLKYPLAVTASPKGAASFSYTGSEVALGAEYYVRATPKTGYKFKEWVVNGVVQTETSTTYNATMTEEGASVIGIFVFDPSSPSNPGANYYNSITGQAIIDDFTPGSLYSALSNVIGSSNYKNVSSLILKGRMDTYDYDCLSYFSNAGTIDLSRTGESTSVPNYAFEDMAVSNILLSSEVSRIGSYAFYNCSNLTSLTLYAQVPPICTNYTFNNFKNRDNCTVYVPASAIELYTTADYWKDFTILPITNDAHLLNVNLPAEAADGRYKHYSLEIVNINSGVRQKYVVSNRLLYTFNGLHKDEKYNIYLYSQSGFEIGKIENVIIPEDDIEVTFKDLKNLHTVNAKVLTADSIDVTSQVSIEWLKPLADGSITYIRKANSIGEIPEGEKLFCRISLDNNLGVMYLAPKDVEFIVKEKETTCSIILEPLRKIELFGTVLDGNGTVLSGASVSVNQSLNVKYNKTFTTKTDRNGMWKLSAFNVPETHITYAAAECINVNDTIGAFELNASTFDVGKIVMKSIVGARITYGITYRSTLDDEPEEFYSDYKNVLISVYNKTQNREHGEVSLQYPILAILDENINGGDELKLTATSKIGAFKPIEQIVKVGEDQRAEVSFDIIGKGAISASYEQTDNASVVAMLYSSKGEFLKKTTYSGLTVKFTELEDGDYTLVTMGQSDLMNSVLRLSNFSEIGLTEGKDYLKNNIKVETGVLSVVKNTIIPTFDESIFYYTNTSTGFSFNKSSVTTGSYLTLRSTIGFKGFYENDISNVALVVDLPEFCDFVEQSVIQGPNMLPYTFDNNRLTVQLGKDYKSLVRFCVLPTKGGSLNVTASVVFDYKGETITQPIGAAISEIKDIEITVPSVVAATSFKVTGTALPKSEVKVYEDGMLLGSGKANGAGSWSVECELVAPYNLSTHSIYAEITTPTGTILTSETKTLTYDINALQVSKVTMYHWNPQMQQTYVSEYDFLNPKTSANQWTVYYPKKVFTYTIEFTSNDPERISNVILYVHTADGKIVPLNASFDEDKGMWYAEINMGTSSDGYYPVNCSVDFDYIEIFTEECVKEQFISSNNISTYQNIEVKEKGGTENEFKISIQGDETDISITTIIEELDVLPKECEVDTIIGGLNIYKISDLKKAEVCYIFDKSQFENYTFSDEFASSSKEWLFAYKSNYIKISTIIVDNNNNDRCRSFLKAPSYGDIARTSSYAGQTARNFYQLDRTARERFQQLIELDNRINALDCIPDDIRDSLRDLIDRLFQQYFDIKVTSTFMQSGRFNMTSPMYAISYAGGWLNFAGEVGFSTQRRKISTYIMSYENMCPPPPGNDGGSNNSGQPNDNVKIDPSGFVYEAVPTNRIEGVQATIYYKETKEDMYGDLYDEVILWNAEEFAQKNPLFTDENGMYRWDVPQGLWQVKFEKDGYQTAYSEWLPVPPPQLEVNIGIVQNKQPEVVDACAYEDGVEVQFDKFMDLTTLSTNNIYVTANGEKIKGNIDFLDAELADEYASKDDPTAIRYASRIRFVPDTQLSVATGELRLTVSRDVLSYAGIPMTETFSQVLDIEKEVKFISASDIKVLYGGETELTVYAMPLEASVGRVLHIHNSSNLIASVDTTEVTLDEEGKAVVKVKGELPGCTQLLFTIDEVTATGSATVDVVSEIITVNAPKSSLPSGTSVYSGTKIELTTDTKGAVIYFTTDGSCPCDRDGTRQKYTGPITISNDTKILAVTSIENGTEEESEIVELNYAVKRSDVDIQLQKGWTWVSHNICNGIPVSELLSNNSVLRIVSQTEEVYKDTELGIVGSLEVLLPSESYMIESSAAIKLQFPNTVLFNPESSICLNEGCNWIGYPLSDTISLDNVFASIDVDTLDVIVGQRGFSQFDGEKWVGTLKVMSPGAGYVYYSKTAKNIVYNTSATTNDSIILTDLEFDIHKYQRLMPVIATIRANGELVDNNANYKVSAFCGNENRGIASVVNGLIMMNVYGNINEKIEFKVTDANGENLIVDNPPLLFSETVNGNINNPYVLETKKHIRAILDDLHFVLTESENGVVGTTPLGYQQLNANSVDVFAGYTTVSHSYFQNESILKHTYQWPNSSYASACSAGPVEALYNAYTYADSLGVLEYKAIAQIIYAQTALRAVNNLGCLPYHDLRNLKDSHPLNYLSQEDTYNEILKDLNEAIATLKMIKPGKESLMAIEGDLYDKGEVDYALSEYRWQKWVQLANTIKLRIAMYFTKPNHARAKQVAIEALSDEIGVLKEDFGPAYKKENTVHPYYLISSSNNGGLSDSRMNASFENILKRTGSPLIEKYFKKNSDNVTDKSNGNVTIKDTDYYGIRQGTDVGVKTEGQGYYNFSEVSEAFKYARQAWVTKEEAIFLKAEYALRWGDDADAKKLYEDGIRSVFNKFGIVDNIDSYLQQTQVVQQDKEGDSYDIDYVDILDAKNNLPGRLNICVAWNNDDSYETKLEKIITQKWVAIFPNGHEAWVDYRRTGYPRLFPSVQQWTGEPTFPVELQLRRIPHDENLEEVLIDIEDIEQALSVFGQQGENSGGQRLYFEGDPNTYPWKYDKETGWFTPINFVESSSEDNTYSSEKELKLYPSPMRNHLTIEGCCAGDKIMIVDMTGRIYYSAISQSEKEIINVSSYPSGLYIVSVGEKVRKVIKID